MAKGKKRVDPLAKRPNETFLQWRSRVVAAKQNARDKSETLITPETERQGCYIDANVLDEDGNLNVTKRNQQTSSLAILRDKGYLTDDQFHSALMIAGVAEAIERANAVRSASMEGRVDCSGSARSQIVESLHAVRMERAYTEWRNRLPFPKRLYIDLVIGDRSMKATARLYRTGWPRAKRLLRDSLDGWPLIWRDTAKMIDQDDVDIAHRRIA